MRLTNKQKSIVFAGGGFGGAGVALHIETIVTDRAHHCFTELDSGTDQR